MIGRRVGVTVGATAALLAIGVCATRAPDTSTTTLSGGPTTSTATDPPTTTSTTPSAPPLVAADQSGCRGLAERTAGDDLTWVEDGELRTRDGCLLRLGGNVLRPSWNAAGDALLVDYELDTTQYVLTAAGARRLDGDRWEWLGATGELVAGGDGPTRVRRADGTTHQVPATDGLWTFASTADGRWLVGEVVRAGVRGLHRIEVATGRAELLSLVEEHGIGQVVMAPGDDVVFVEHVGDRSFLRRREAVSGRVTDLADAPKASGLWVAVSRYDPTAMAWYVGGSCGGPPTMSATRGGRRLRVTGEPEGAAPQAWLRDGTLLLTDNGESCDYAPGTLWSFRDGRARRLGERVVDVAVR